jgi:prolyl-tRNA synthetase
MKDLYTFDYSSKLALDTYEQVRKAYKAIFDELKVPYLVADADSGDMGGDLSHEYHFPTPQGEDNVISCSKCHYVANEELAQGSSPASQFQEQQEWKFVESIGDHTIPITRISSTATFSVWRGVSKDRATLVNVWYSLLPLGSVDDSTPYAPPEVNTHAVKAFVPSLDPGVENAGALWATNIRGPTLYSSESCRSEFQSSVINLIDYRLPSQVRDLITSGDSSLPFLPFAMDDYKGDIPSSTFLKDLASNKPTNLLRIQDGDACSKCEEGTLRVQKAIELGHTFFLGTRYSDPLNAMVALPDNTAVGARTTTVVPEGRSNHQQNSTTKVPLQMGCHGIGVSRMIGAVAETLADKVGLNWPRIIAPYEAVIIPVQGIEAHAIDVYDILTTANILQTSTTTTSGLDVVLDDRAYPFPWKMNDADLIGYPVIIVMGKAWKRERACQVQCRRLGIVEDVPFDRLREFVTSLLIQL